LLLLLAAPVAVVAEEEEVELALEDPTPLAALAAEALVALVAALPPLSTTVNCDKVNHL
jgi:hypothetical protein